MRDGAFEPPPDGAAPPRRADELLRWRQTAMDPSALPARAADLVDAARDVPATSRAVLARIYAELEARGGTAEKVGARTDARTEPRAGARTDERTAGARPPARPRRLPLGLRLATLAVLLLVSVATAKGAMVLWHRYRSPIERMAPARPTEPVERGRAPARLRLAAAQAPEPRDETGSPVEEGGDGPSPAPALDSTPSAAPAADAAVGITPRRRRHAPSAERHAPSARIARAETAEAADTADEAQLLGDALARLRQARDPRGALVLLDRYAATYPHGVLVAESRSARLEAMLKLDDRRGALALLDEGTSFTGRLGVEQLVTRAELRASAGRYADALGDFDRVLAPATALGAPGAPGAWERALYGRAVTLGHLGRDARARADLETYRRRFPDGKHAAEVARLLGRAP